MWGAIGQAGVLDALPDGWTIERVRGIEPSAELLDVETHRAWLGDGSDFEELPPPVCILSFHGVCLVRVEGGEDWWMGDLDVSDGSIVCWSPYGSDLELAIRSL